MADATEAILSVQPVSDGHAGTAPAITGANRVLTSDDDGAAAEWLPLGALDAAAPLSRILIVDENSEAGSEDGSFALPFLTVQAAIDAAPATPDPAEDGATILIVAATADEDITIAGKSVNLVAWRPFVRRPLGGGYVRGGEPVRLGTVTATGSMRLGISGIRCGAVSAQCPVYISDGCDMADTVTTTQDLYAADAEFADLVTTGLDPEFTDCRFSATGALVVTEGVSILMQGCSFTGGAAVSVGFDIAGVLYVDAVTNYRWKAKTESITNGTKTIVGDLSA